MGRPLFFACKTHIMGRVSKQKQHLKELAKMKAASRVQRSPRRESTSGKINRYAQLEGDVY